MAQMFEITQRQLAEAVIAMAHYVEHLQSVANDPAGREIDVVLARHHLKSALPRSTWVGGGIRHCGR